MGGGYMRDMGTIGKIGVPAENFSRFGSFQLLFGRGRARAVPVRGSESFSGKRICLYPKYIVNSSGFGS